MNINSIYNTWIKAYSKVKLQYHAKQAIFYLLYICTTCKDYSYSFQNLNECSY